MRRHAAFALLAASMALAMALVGSTLFAAPGATQARSRFPHERHARVFPLCTTCHAGVVEAGRTMFPEPTACASCHDGTVERRVQWQPRPGPRPGNRRFTHEAHSRAAAAKNPAYATLIENCAACHVERGAPRMAVRNAVVGQCIDCHGYDAPHFDLPSEACATCHVRLTDAPSLTREEIARFPKPSWHDAPDFVLGGHGKLAKASGGSSGRGAIAASCATCHAQNLCLTCHVNAPESPVIRALALDDRSPAYTRSQPVPPSHAARAFLRTHGREAQRASATCAVCHTQESCSTCHLGSTPRAIAALAAAGPGRATGAVITRTPPPTHTAVFRDRHASEANARPTTCETCHVRTTCFECHRPEAAREATYHPSGFLTRHPSSAYTREANCSDCHNPSQFCQSCHQQSGLVSRSRIGPRGYHDTFRGFSLGHGQAARQSLESCVSCHAERDCTACHSAVGGGFRFNPHGPSFDATRMRAKNPSLCRACHGNVIPGGR